MSRDKSFSVLWWKMVLWAGKEELFVNDKGYNSSQADLQQYVGIVTIIEVRYCSIIIFQNSTEMT